MGEPPALISAGPRYRSRSSGAESSCRSQSDFWLRAAYENMMIYHIELPMKITFSPPEQPMERPMERPMDMALLNLVICTI